MSALAVGAVATLGSSSGGSSIYGSAASPVFASSPSGSGAITPAALATARQITNIASSRLLPPEPRVVRSQRAAPPPPEPLATSAVSATSRFSSGLIAAPVILSALGIPEIELNAYRAAELVMMAETPRCGLPWHLLAGIGRIESGHAGGGRTDSIGTTLTPILGPLLDGRVAGNMVIRDTDGGAMDGDSVHDRAVGPMQFIPSTWAKYASDGNADGVADPNNVFDSSLAAGRYLCSGGIDLSDPHQEAAAVLRYNNSAAYVSDVITWSNAYKRGEIPTPGQLAGSTPRPPSQLADTAGDESDPADDLDTTPTPESPAPDMPLPVPADPRLPGIPGLPQLPCLIFCPPPEPAPSSPGLGAPAPAPVPSAPR
ncbi:lytic transglycosylase [Rhodococcus sp. WMMA185]|uniref:lytic transglycosylase domain-containing protein n=1 Tax=Rhodococcus sp. WMMA185 TaxID=679318 RepID=UPI00087D3D83|nr:lytic murein transglycosylase [Rhodococcus sp. WMMA185]AOW94336.1 lytic transglycosylase [Rhodococcus sp. WMMA185]